MLLGISLLTFCLKIYCFFPNRVCVPVFPAFCLLPLTNFEIFGCDEGSWALTQPPRDVVGENSHHAPSNVGVCWSASKSVAVWVRLRFMGFNPKPKQASGGTESISAPVDKTSQSNELLLSRVSQAAKTPSSHDRVVWTQPKHSFSTPLLKCDPHEYTN